uniref:Periphilin 1 n=1 Tax=Dicentrarchus labrax TaxID=13489 RepID=A0A8C4FAV2_DICLA
YRTSPPVKRDRSPGRREAQPPVRSGSNTSNRSFSPDRDKGYSHQQSQKKRKFYVSVDLEQLKFTDFKKSQSHHSVIDRLLFMVSPLYLVISHRCRDEDYLLVCSLLSISICCDIFLTDKPVVPTSHTPSNSVEESPHSSAFSKVKAAISTSIHYRRDCETFRTVVKMLVAKEPSLDNLLQAPLDENLLEIKQRCLDALKHFVKELDEAF